MRPPQARVLLTGASGGIGRESARALLRAGASLMLVGRDAAGLQAQARELGQAEHEAEADSRIAVCVADLGVDADLQRLATHAADWGANVLVHGAGLPAFGRLQALPAAELRALLNTNLLAPMLLTQALLPHLLSLPSAQIICLGSALGRIGLPGFAAYSASKFGLRGFAEALRRELAGSPVRVQYLGPRSTRTDFNNAAVQAYNRATGTAMDSPARVAQALVALLQSERPELFLGFPEALAVRLNGLVGPWLDRAFSKHRLSLPPLPASPASLHR